MTEFQSFLKLSNGGVKKCYLIKNPANTFSFVGHVDNKLCNAKDGLWGLQYSSKTFETKSEALSFAKQLNIEVETQ